MDTPVETSTPDPAVAPVAQPEAASIADHAASFDPANPPPDPDTAALDDAPDSRSRDGQGRFAPHRARSQRASSDDVGRIHALTKKWRTEETARKDLEARYSTLEQEVAALRPKAPTETPKPFDAKPPQLEDFDKEADPLTAWQAASYQYFKQKDAAESAKTAHATATAEQTAAAKAREVELKTAYVARETAFKRTMPDYDAIVSQVTEPLPDLLSVALLEDDKSAELVYALASRPAFLAEAVLASDGRAITARNVAMLRRLLAARMPVATSGSTAPPTRAYVPPPPTNPVRTGPIKSADEPPGEGSSIADHARYYGPKRR